MFCCALRLDKIIPTVNVRSEKCEVEKDDERVMEEMSGRKEEQALQDRGCAGDLINRY